MSKPLPGKEAEFKEIFLTLSGQVKEDINLLERLFGRKKKVRKNYQRIS